MKNLLFVFIFLSNLAIAQDSTNLKQVAREVIAKSTHCNLITIDKEGRPRARVMDAFDPEEDFTVWLASNPRSRKVEQLKANPYASLYYLAPDGMSYVLIIGKAILVNSMKSKKKYWKEGWESFYPNKRKDMVLIKVIPESMEVVSYAHGLLGDPKTWKPLSFDFKK